MFDMNKPSIMFQYFFFAQVGNPDCIAGLLANLRFNE